MRVEFVPFSRSSAPERAVLRAERRGFHVRVVLSSGSEGWGEVSPLPGFSRETTELAHRELMAVAEGAPFASMSPSVQFGLSSARERALRAEGSGDADLAALPVNGLVTDLGRLDADLERAEKQGIEVVKLKVGRPGCLERELSAGDIIGRSFRLRLDANRAFSGIWKHVAVRWQALRPELFEEPAPWYEVGPDADRIALGWDETTREVEPVMVPEAAPAAVVLKPTLLGSVDVVRDWAKWAKDQGADVIITHAYESEVGLRVLYELALELGSSNRAQGLLPHRFVDSSAGPRVERGKLFWP
ncbi:MAG: hypothetical protein ACFB9M_06570 [Myxococcota bacterium]